MLEETEWDDTDFDRLGWHDVQVHAWVASPDTFEIAFDIDYILEWITPTPPEVHFRFRVAPATLVFADVFDVDVHYESSRGDLTLEDLNRQDAPPSPNGTAVYRWSLEAHEGSITLLATGFRQFLRRRPVLVDRPFLSLAERGGVSFARGGAA